jgi:hypothetical protein
MAVSGSRAYISTTRPAGAGGGRARRCLARNPLHRRVLTINNATAGDEVVVGAGNRTVSQTSSHPSALTVH